MEDNIRLYEQCYYYGTMNTGLKVQKYSGGDEKRFSNFHGKRYDFPDIITEYVEYGDREKNFIYTAAQCVDMQDGNGRYNDMSHIMVCHDPDDISDPRSYVRCCFPFYYKDKREPREELQPVAVPPLENSDGTWLSLRDIAAKYQLMDGQKLTVLLKWFYANLFRDDTLVILLDDGCFSYEAEENCYRQAAEWMLFLHMIVPKCCGGFNEYDNLRKGLKYCVTNKADGHTGSICFIPRSARSSLSNQRVFDYKNPYSEIKTDSLYGKIAQKILADLMQESLTAQDSMQCMQDFLMSLTPDGKKFEASRQNLRHRSLAEMEKAFGTQQQSVRFSDAEQLIVWEEAGIRDHLKKGAYTPIDVNVCVDYLRHLQKFAAQGGREQIPEDKLIAVFWQYLSEDSEKYQDEMLFLMSCSAATEEVKKACLLQAADKVSFLQRYCQQPDNYLYALADKAAASKEDMQSFCELLRRLLPESSAVIPALTERLCSKAADAEVPSTVYRHFCECTDDWQEDGFRQEIHGRFFESFLQKAEAYCTEQPEDVPLFCDKLLSMLDLCMASGRLSGDYEAGQQERLQTIVVALTKRRCDMAAASEDALTAYSSFCDDIGQWDNETLRKTAYDQCFDSFLQKAEAYSAEQPDDIQAFYHKLQSLLALCETAEQYAGDIADEPKKQRLQAVRASMCQRIIEEVQQKDYTHLFRITPSFDVIGFLKIWKEIRFSDYAAVYAVSSEEQRADLTFFNSGQLPETDLMPEEDSVTGWMSYTMFLLYCMLLSDAPDGGFEQADTFYDLQELIRKYKWKTPDEYQVIRDFLCLPEIMERHRQSACPDYFALADHVAPQHRIYQALYPHVDDIGEIIDAEKTAYTAARNLWVYQWVCVIVPEIAADGQTYVPSGHTVDEKTLCHVLKEVFPDRYKDVLTEQESEMLLSRIQTMAQDFLDHRTASGSFYCTLAQYPAFYDWLNVNAEMIYTGHLTSLVHQYVFYYELENDAAMKERMDDIIRKHIKNMVCGDLKTLLEELHQQDKVIAVNAYAKGAFGYVIVTAAQENINTHLSDLVKVYSFESFCRLSHEEQRMILDAMKSYCAAYECVNILTNSFDSSMNKVKKRFNDAQFPRLQSTVNAYDLEASIYYDAASGGYDFSVIKKRKDFFRDHYKELSERTLKYAAYAAYLYVYTTGGDYFNYLKNSLDANKHLSAEDKNFLVSYLIWLLQSFQQRVYSTADEQRAALMEKESDECMRKIGIVFERVDQYIDNVCLTRGELYRILWQYGSVGSRSWYQTSNNNESFFKEYDLYCQLQRELKNNNSTDWIYHNYKYACYAYQNTDMTDEEKQQLYALLKQCYDKMGKKDKQKHSELFGGMEESSDAPTNEEASAAEFDAQYNMPSPVQNQKVVYGSASDIFGQSAQAHAVSIPSAGDRIRTSSVQEPSLHHIVFQWICLSTEENIGRFEECIRNNCFDEATQKLWDEWLDLYAQLPDCLCNFISHPEINWYINQELEWRSMHDSSETAKADNSFSDV